MLIGIRLDKTIATTVNIGGLVCDVVENRRPMDHTPGTAETAGEVCQWQELLVESDESETGLSLITNSIHPYWMQCEHLVNVVQGRSNRSGRPGDCRTNNLTNKNFYVHISTSPFMNVKCSSIVLSRWLSSFSVIYHFFYSQPSCSGVREAWRNRA